LHNFQTGESRCIVTGEDFDEDASTHMWASFSHDSRYVVIHADFHNDRIVRILDTHTNELVGVPQRKVEPDRELCAAFFDPQTRFVVVRDFSHNTRVLRPVLYINSLPEDEEDVTYQLQQLLILRLLQGHGELDLQGSHDLLCIFSSLPAHIQTTLRCENYTS
jgi:hypothetical protein